MDVGILSLVLFIVIVSVVTVVLKRSCAEGMFLAWLVILFLGGAKAPELAVSSLKTAFTTEVVFPTMAFCFMSTLMLRTGIIERLVQIFNSIFGRIAGGAGYVSTCASALMGMVSGNGPGNAAVSGSITIPWMLESGFPKHLATTIVAGNATLGASIPPSTVMFLLLALPAVEGVVSSSELYLTCFCGGMWLLLLRFITVFGFTRAYHIQPVDKSSIRPLRETVKKGGTSLSIFLGILIPLVVTIGPLSEALKAIPSIGSAGIKSVDMIVWIPVMMCVIAAIEGHKLLPHSAKEWFQFIDENIGTYANVGGTLLFSLAGGAVMKNLGMSEELQTILSHVTQSVSPFFVLLIVGGIIMLAAGPLSTTATLTALGSVCFTALTSIGMRPSVALTAIIIFGATEGSMPPSSSPLFVASGISGLDNPVRCFKLLAPIYAGGSALIAILIGTGILPVL